MNNYLRRGIEFSYLLIYVLFSIVFMFISPTIMVTLIIFRVFVFCNKIKTNWWFTLWIHHAHYLNQFKYGLEHTFLDVVDFNIFGLEIISLFTFFRLEVLDLPSLWLVRFLFAIQFVGGFKLCFKSNNIVGPHLDPTPSTPWSTSTS
jgi:hypothetical protein